MLKLNILKPFLRRVEEFLGRIILGLRLQEFIWSTRNIYRHNMVKDFLEPADHSHRNQMVETVSRFSKINSIIGLCFGSGAEGGKFFGGRWVYDLEKLLHEMLPNSEINIYESEFKGGLWDDSGTLIVIHL